MMGPKERITLAMAVMFLFCFLNYSAAEESGPDSAVQAFTSFKQALQNNDYSKAWQLIPKKTQEKGFNNSLERFIGAMFSPQVKDNFGSMEVKEAKHLTDIHTAFLVNEPMEVVYMLKEDGEWKFDGPFKNRLKFVKKNLETLNNAIKKYYSDNKSLPSDLSQLVPNYIPALPVDPFNENGPFTYKIRSDTIWIIYSFGPNMKDDLGMVYDPNNGILSDGDIVAGPDTN